MAMVVKINDEAIKTIEFTESMHVALLWVLSLASDAGEPAADPISLFSQKKIID